MALVWFSSPTHAISLQGLWPGGFVLSREGALEREKTLLVFGSLDSGPGQMFSGAGVKYAPFGPLDQSGFRLLARAGAGQWQDKAKPLSAQTKIEGYALAGGDQMTGRGTIGIYVGPELAFAMPAGGARNAAAAKGAMRKGLRIQAEIWDHPTPETLFQLSGAISSAKGEIWVRKALGHSLVSLHPSLDAFAGPEAETTVAAGYSKWRFGLHVTGARLFNVQFRVSAGREQASDKLRGVYVAAGMHWTR